MDKLKDMASKMGGNSSGSSTQQTSNTSGQEDYLDKGLDAAEKKFGGGKIDPAAQRSTNEKITDSGREYFEKATGKNVPDKFSN